MSELENSKVLIYSVAYFPHVGGAEVAWKEITDRLPDIQFEMVTARLDSRLPKKEKVGNVLVHRVGIGIPALDKIILILWGPVKGFLLGRTLPFTHVIGLMYSQASLAASFFKVLSPRTIYILNLQDGDSDEYINKKVGVLKKFLQRIYTKADQVTVISNFLQERAAKNGFLGTSHLIPNGVNLHLFVSSKDALQKNLLKEHLGLSPLDKVIVTTSRLNYKNALDDVIKALSYLPSNFYFVIIGIGEEEENLRKISRDLEVEKRVLFLGLKSHTEIIEYLQLSDFFCRPSLQEGLGISFLEAMAMELPVVATPVGGIPDFLEDSVTGLFCQVRNPQSIAEAITKLAHDEKLRTTVTENAKKLVFQKYDWDTIASDYRKLFLRV